MTVADHILTMDLAGVEINLGIICASLPTLKPLVSRFIGRQPNPKLAHSSGDTFVSPRRTVTLKNPMQAEELALRETDVARSNCSLESVIKYPSTLPTRRASRTNVSE